MFHPNDVSLATFFRAAHIVETARVRENGTDMLTRPRENVVRRKLPWAPPTRPQWRKRPQRYKVGMTA
jgi:hypothetical protein